MILPNLAFEAFSSNHNEANEANAAASIPHLKPHIQFMPEGVDHAHHEAAIDRAFRYAGIGAAAISITPVILKQMGIGIEEFEWVANNCCPVTEKRSFTIAKTRGGLGTWGIAGTVSALLERIPIVGGELSRGGIANAIAGGGLMVAGHYAGRAVERLEKQKGFKGRIGKFIRDASQVFGVVLTLPAILPGVGHGALVLSSALGIDKLDKDNLEVTGPAATLAGILGKVPGPCKAEAKLTDGATGAGTIILAQLCCALPAIIGALPIIFSGTQNKEMGHGR